MYKAAKYVDVATLLGVSTTIPVATVEYTATGESANVYGGETSTVVEEFEIFE